MPDGTKISDDDLIEISGGIEGPFIGFDEDLPDGGRDRDGVSEDDPSKLPEPDSGTGE